MVKLLGHLVKDLSVEVTRLCSEGQMNRKSTDFAETLQGQDTRSCVLQKKGHPS